MSDKSSSRSSGIGLWNLMGLMFIGLKLGGVIAWSWWLVLLPFYIWILAILLAVLLSAVFGDSE